jgi:hypothetical protein
MRPVKVRLRITVFLFQGLVFTTGNEHFPLTDATYGQVLNNADIVLRPPDGVIQGS